MAKFIRRIELLFVDDKAESEFVELFGKELEDNEIRIHQDNEQRDDLTVKISSNPLELVRKMQTGDVAPDAILLDVDFSELSDDLLSLLSEELDPPKMPKERLGIQILRTLKRINPDIPVFIFSDDPQEEVYFDAGQQGADDFLRKRGFTSAQLRESEIENLYLRIRNRMNFYKDRAAYDHDHMEKVDDFSVDYDAAECKRIATVAYYHFENKLIEDVVTQLVKTSTDTVRVLDLGCGTGRIEKLLATHPGRSQLEVVGIDFSSGMISESMKQLENVDEITLGLNRAEEDVDTVLTTLFRAPAERLSFLNKRYPQQFDFVILGFGFLSYVKYVDIIPPAAGGESAGVRSILKESGRLLFSVYNEKSLAYSEACEQFSQEESPIAAKMALEDGTLEVGDKKIACEAFSMDRMARLLKQGGYELETMTTFPTVHLTLPNSHADGFDESPQFPLGKFNQQLYDLDLVVSKALENRGHYIVGICRFGSG